MPANQQNQPESGSRTLTQTATPARDSRPNANEAGPSDPVGVLKLRGGPSRRQKVVWSEETVDNEGMGKKKSKICCIYHKPKAYDQSSDESESDCDHDHHPKPASKSRRKADGGDPVAESSESEGGGGDGKAKPAKKTQKLDTSKEGAKGPQSDKAAKVNRYDYQGTS